jgi:integrase
MKGAVHGSRGDWWFVVDLPRVGGKRQQAKRRGFATKAAAEEEMRKLIESVRTGTFVKPSRRTVADYLNDTWLPSIAQRVRPTTADSYRRHVKNHIASKLGPAELQSLDEAAVERWVADLRASGLSAKTVRNVHGTLSKALGDALRLRLVPRNAASRTELPRVPSRKPQVWTSAQLRAFLGHVADDRWAPMWRLLAMTGMRRGEVLGLRWADVDLDGGSLTVSQQRTIAGGKVVQGPPKTPTGARTIALDGATAAALRSLRRSQAAERLAMGAGWIDTGGLVFAWGDGSPVWPQVVTSWFKSIAGELKLPTIGVHGLRHTAATLMIASGESPKLVSQRLGHAHVSITLQLYSHVLPAHDRDAANRLAAVLDA